MRLIFMGTPDFAVPALNALVAAGHELLCVYTQPARAAGRGRKARPSPVQVAAARLGLTVRHPVDLKAETERAAFAALDADVAVVAAYGLILPRPVLEAPRHGCINIHASLLPRWRGAAPIQRAILAGDRESGVTIMQMEAGLDTGPMLLREAVPIDEATTGGMLHDRLAPLGARLIVDALRRLEAGTLVATPQPEEGATYARKIDKAETRIDWSEDAGAVLRRIRAFAPAPGAWCEIGDERVKILAATAADGGGPPGAVLDDGLAVACGSGAVRIATLQRAGRGSVDAGAFLRGFAVPQGTRLS